MLLRSITLYNGYVNTIAYNKIDCPDLDKLLYLYKNEKRGCAYIATAFGVYDSLVRSWLKREGVTIRSRSEAAKLTLNGFSNGDAHYLWKGDVASYNTLHRWVQRHLGTPSKCEHCGLEDPQHPRRFQWANKSHEYKRDLSDWIRMCVSCHLAYDKAHRMEANYGRNV